MQRERRQWAEVGCTALHASALEVELRRDTALGHANDLRVLAGEFDHAPASQHQRWDYICFLFFAAVAFFNALLLFLIQPMFAKAALPLLGGSPAVWTTCMLFFQAALLAGYLYAHASTKLLGVRRQAALHMALAPLPLLVLPVAIGVRPPPGNALPIIWLIGVMTSTVGLPFFVLSTTAPLLQRWLSSASGRAKVDPYLLYAGSNAGSLAALLTYPTLIEPRVPLSTQGLAWTIGYALNAAALVACAALALRSTDHAETARAAGPVVAAGRKLRWVALAFVPSGLMLAVTSHISTDIAAVPLLWIVPLALYLSTFVIAFSGGTTRLVSVARRVLPFTLLPVVLFLTSQATAELWFIIPLHLATFWILALLCHSELAQDRPGPDHLTEFYVWVAVGGVAGGLFNTLAPLLFVRVAEYPILIAATCLILAGLKDLRLALVHPRGLLRPAAGGLLAAVILGAAWQLALEPRAIVPVLGVSALLCFSVSKQRAQFAIGVALLLAAGLPWPSHVYGHVLHAERTFFGVYRVTEDLGRRFVSLFHGTTLHGRESTTRRDRPDPLTYYHRGGPIADVFADAEPRTINSVGVIGLGVGSLAAYARPGQRWTFYEIDPAVERIARDERYFTFLSACGDRCRVVLGDGRLSVAARPETYDVLVLDAFSSDAIPIHLLTREAIQIYLSRLSDSGVMAFHISNRHFDLEPVLAGLALDQRMTGLARIDRVDNEALSGFSTSCWVVLARSAERLRGLAASPNWIPLRSKNSLVWTDDFSNIWSVLHWQ